MKRRIIAFALPALFLFCPSSDTCHDRNSHASYLLSLYGEFAGRPEGGESGFEHPELAALREYMMTMDPVTRTIPRETLVLSAREAGNRARRQGLKAEGSLYAWEELQADIGGRTRAVMYDPNDPEQKKVWAGAVTGGLWYKEDIKGYADWQPVDDFWPSLSISCMAFNPDDTEEFYLGTGEGQTAVLIYRESSGKGSGIWKSSDAGRSWQQLESTTGFVYVTDILVRSEGGKSVVYAGVTSGKYKGAVHESQPGDGLYRSEDGGDTWTQVLPDIPGTGRAYAVADIELTSGGRLFVGTQRNVGLAGGGTILYSDNGTDWKVRNAHLQQLTGRNFYNIPGRVILAAAPSDPDRIYSIIGGGLSRYGFIYSRGVLMLRSDDAGVSWKEIPMPDETGDWSFLAWHALAAGVDPADPDHVWVGGLDLYRSVDKGASWQWMSAWWNFGPYRDVESPNYVHADQHAIKFKPGTSDELLIANDGGVFTSSNARAFKPGFRERNSGYNTLQYYTCAIHPEAGRNYYLGGTQDNGTFRTTNLPTSLNTNVSYGDGAFCFIDRDQPDIQISMSQFNSFYFSSDGQHKDIEYLNADGGIFINPVDYDDAGNVAYANGQDFDGRFQDTIIRIRGIPDYPFEQFVKAGTGSQLPFSALTVSPRKKNNSTRVFLGSQSGRLFRLDHAEDVPQATEIGSTRFPAGNISCIALGDTDDEILVCFSNYHVPSVWYTVDGGGTWTNASGDLPDMPVRWAVFSPVIEGNVLLATELGVWYTNDIGASEVSWEQSLNGLPNVRVDMLQARKSDGAILAATHGRGLFLSTAPVDVADPELPANPLMTVYPNPGRGPLTVRLEGLPASEIELVLLDLSGRVIRSQWHQYSGQEQEFRFETGTIAAGNYLLSCRTGQATINRIITFH